MKTKLVYVEAPEKNSPAWIGRAFLSKSGKTFYFNGKAFKNGRETISGDIYWISGVKKDMTDRLWARTRKIKIDQSVVDEYLKTVGLAELPKSRFEIVNLNNEPPKEDIYEIENQKLGDKAKSLYQNEWKWQQSQKK
jgi:hypothetical protein